MPRRVRDAELLLKPASDQIPAELEKVDPPKRIERLQSDRDTNPIA
jgi:hypothetical protein